VSATPRHIILRWQSDKMAPRPDLVLQNVLKNATDGTYGLVSVLNATLTEESSNDSINDSSGVKDLDTTMAPPQSLPSLLNDSFNITNDELLFPSNDSLLDGCADHLHIGNITHHLHKATNLSEIPVKEIIIVLGMLGLWFYSIVLTRKAWYRILKE